MITKAAKEQLRPWPSQWSLSLDMTEILEFLENDDNDTVDTGEHSFSLCPVRGRAK